MIWICCVSVSIWSTDRRKAFGSWWRQAPMVHVRNRMNLIFRAFLLSPLVLSPITAAAAESSGKVANLVSSWNKAGAPGLAWVVISNRFILEQNQFGLASLEQGTLITSKTRFNI